MASNPYTSTWIRRRRNQARVEGGLGVLRALGLPLLASLLLVPLVRPVFLPFLDDDPATWGDGLQAVALRAGLLVVGWLSLDLYTAIVRGPDREVLAILPVDPAGVVRAEVLRIAVERWWLVAGAALVLAPLGVQGAPGLWGLAVGVVAGAWAMGLSASAMVHLLAIEVSESERWAPLLDLLRGNNPRPQAAFLYAPGVVLGAAGIGVVQAAGGARAVWAGDPSGAVWLVVPWLLAAVAWIPVARLARHAWFRGSAVLAEIDARYAALQDPEEGHRVYLDWAVRFLPAGLGRYALKDLRHGWRARRTLVMAAWGLGLVAFGAGWTESDIGPQRVAITVVFGTFLCTGVGTLMARDDPPFLEAWLPPGGVSRWGARALVLCAWALPCPVLGAIAVLLRRSPVEAGFVLAVGAVSLGLAVPLVIGTTVALRQRAAPVYGPVAAVLAAALATVVGTA